MKSPKQKSLDEAIASLKRTYQSNEGYCSYEPRDFISRCPEFFSKKMNEFNIKAKTLIIQNFFIENNVEQTAHALHIPIIASKVIANPQHITSPLNSVTNTADGASQCADGLNSFFHDNTIDAKIHAIQNNYLINVAFPAFFSNFISDDFTKLGRNVIKQYYTKFGFDGYLEQLIGSFMTTSFYSITSIEDRFYHSICYYLVENDFSSDQLDMTTMIKLFITAFIESLSSFPSDIIELLRELSSKEENKGRIEILLLDYVIVPLIKRCVFSPYFAKTPIFIDLLNEDIGCITLIPIIEEKIKNEQEMKNCFGKFWEELSSTSSRLPFTLKGVMYGKPATIYLSILDIIYLGKVLDYANVRYNVLRTAWSASFTPDINDFESAFLLFPDLAITIPQVEMPPNLGAMEIRPGDEKKKKQWDLIHSRISSEGISPIDEFVESKYSSEFVKFALECENDLLQKSIKCKDIMREKMANLRPMDDNCESVERVLNEISYLYARTYPLKASNPKDPYAEHKKLIREAIFSFLIKIGTERIKSYGAQNLELIGKLTTAFTKVFKKSNDKISVENHAENADMLVEAIRLASIDVNQTTVSKDSNVYQHAIHHLKSFIRYYVQYQSLFFLDKLKINLDLNNSKKRMDALPESTELVDMDNLRYFKANFTEPFLYAETKCKLFKIVYDSMLFDQNEMTGLQMIAISAFEQIITSIIMVNPDSNHHIKQSVQMAQEMGRGLVGLMFENEYDEKKYPTFAAYAQSIRRSKETIDKHGDKLGISKEIVNSINTAFSWFYA